MKLEILAPNCKYGCKTKFIKLFEIFGYRLYLKLN